MKVREMSPDERPREKAKREGLSALSNRELIALLLQSGTKSKSVLELADEVLSLCGSLGELMYMDPSDLMEINGIKEVRAIQLFAGIELCRRIDRSSLEKVAICSPDDLVRWLRLSYGYAQQEHFIAVYLNQQNEILHHRVLFIGTLNASMVHPREVFKEAMRQSASSIICAHNHPGGSAEPSSADHHVTRQIVESGKIVGIPLMDHIIVSPNAWFSFRQSGFID